MSRIYTYSFEDTSLTISHPAVGSFDAYGTGIGDISIEFANDVTTHEVAADLAVIVSKSVKKNATITINALQTSELNAWLTKWANYIESAPTQQFAIASAVLKNSSTGEQWNCTGVSHQKKSGGSFKSTAETKQWVLMAANVEQQ
jgi:hypothetical protein